MILINILPIDIVKDIVKFIPYVCKWCGIKMNNIFNDLCNQCILLRYYLKQYEKQNKVRKNIRRFSYNNFIYLEGLEFLFTETYGDLRKYGHVLYNKVLLTVLNCLPVYTGVLHVLDICKLVMSHIEDNIDLNYYSTCHRIYCDLCIHKHYRYDYLTDDYNLLTITLLRDADDLYNYIKNRNNRFYTINDDDEYCDNIPGLNHFKSYLLDF
jgi:hypothetical protein